MTETIPAPGFTPSPDYPPYFTSTAPPAPPPRARPSSPLWLHALLFLATIVTTYMTGGAAYSATLLAILLAHEMGHYLAARFHHVPASLPYFVPLPHQVSLFGTMGAVIRMGHLGADRRQLFDIGVAGPIAGLVVAIPACFFGIHLSTVVPVDSVSPDSMIQSPLLFQWISDLVKGPLPKGQDLLLHPMAFAGWAGLFVTSLNLLPIGQLDGGHVLYALFERPWSTRISLIVALVFLGMALIYSQMYIVFAILAFAFRRHPPTFDDHLPITPRRRLIGVVLLVMFVLCFTPKPF